MASKLAPYAVLDMHFGNAVLDTGRTGFFLQNA